ncbi:M16 family metallopeptidase [Congregibacter litoralis]|uniref:Putative Zn-dependent peptidase n=1 Tax=Congregibacter litoralis KT71 TaxID=314285 RepID=A4A7U5_9GAMM|nr:pitrilysin family protein [Congregibacter litoralis]EAQ97740.1 putative Zn-dependent peptidase [Congregibacter litoralis KT71]
MKMFRSTVGSLTAAIAIFGMVVGPVTAQDTTHPQRMALPAVKAERPAPESMQVMLDNGLVAYVAEDHRAPLTTLTAYIGVGSGHGAPGEAPALAAALRRGPASMARDEFQSLLGTMNAEFRVRQHHELTEVFLDVPAAKTADALTLLAAVLSAPAFEGAESLAIQSTTSPSIDYNYSLVNAVAMFEKRLFANHPFGRKATAEQGTAAAGTGARSLHKRYVVAKNTTLAVAGDFKRNSVVKATRKAFGSLADNAPPAPTTFPPLSPPQERELLLSDADRIQGWVVIGHELPRVPVEDQAALDVMDYILGAYHLDSRLYRSSRETRGLTNDNSAFLEPGIRGPGAYSFRTYGRPEAVRLLVDVTFRELTRIRESLATDDELFVAKGALVDGIYATRYATGVDTTQAYAKEWLSRGDHETSASYPDRVAAVTAESVRAAAQRYIHPERMIVAVLGPLDKIEGAPAIESEPQLQAWSGTSP